MRQRHIDGLRGVAIALVVLFHAFARWPGLYGDGFSRTPVLAQGRVGVQLFFLISGFVILMTLERCEGFRDFMARRWRRLFPAMAWASIILFVTAPLFEHRPQGVPVMRDLLPGLTFVAPDWWAGVLGSPQGVLEGAFWSLFVEMKFYLVFGLSYFTLGPTRALCLLIGLFLAPIFAGHVGATWVYDLSELLGSWHYGWFAAGAIFYRFVQSKNWRIFALACGVGVFAAVRMQPGLVVASLAVVSLFAIALTVPSVAYVLGSAPVVFLGTISYPLYLLHENAMVSMIVSMGSGVLNRVLSIAFVVLVAWLFTRYIEPLRLPASWLPRRAA